MIKVELTDTFGGEANYSWVKRFDLEECNSHLQIVRKAKKEAGWSGLKCKVERYSDMIRLKPYGVNQVMFINLW